MQTSETLDLAANLIEQRGWVSGSGWPGEEEFGGPGLGLCLEGGIMAALGMTMGNDRFRSLRSCPSFKAVSSYLDHDGGSLFRWNDTPGRTAAEVIEVLRACAVIEHAREVELAAVTV